MGASILARDLLRARSALERGDHRGALRKGWAVAQNAVPLGDKESLRELVDFARELEAQSDGRIRADASTLATYSARSLDDLRAGVPRNTTVSLLLGGLDSTRAKSCPDCAERVQGAAKVCRYCGYRFEPPA
jgi:hypothetical protein